ncbi:MULTISPECIES: DUF6257 family protein [Streptomyces]|uniref:DUF6257 family protein n=1 Tax=Streptomyces TaxID=1883 RepID=UPI00167A1EF4|nr:MULTISPECIES: DUF6257 family protein [Streptomyces]MBD3577229.1 hypothetical protein [Streptomyces sp. KD18]GGS86399.1 hypothetical protein GCM10010286_08820 [Streptomyces toxytricini]
MGQDPKFTPGEVAQIAWYTARMAKRGIASQTVYQGDLERKVDRIIDAARERTDREAAEARENGKRK